MLSRGARLCESIIRAARPRAGGVRECGRPYLARRLGCSPRTVSRYVAELRQADRLTVTPPRRHRTAAGWRTEGVNRYQLTGPPNPAPHVVRRSRRSSRGDTHDTPPLNRGRAAPLTADPPPTEWTPASYLAHLLATEAGSP